MTPIDGPTRRARPRFPAFAIALACALLLPATAAARPGPVAGTPQSALAAPVSIRVMSFNILYGGDEVDYATGHPHWCQDPAGCAETMERVAGAIRASGADIVGMQEGTGNGCRIAACSAGSATRVSRSCPASP